MAEFLTITIQGLDGIDKELSDALYEMKKPIRRGLETASLTFVPVLQQHIETDWEDTWGEPIVYHRRTNYPELGTPLGSEEYMNTEIGKDGMSLRFDYTPKGKHKKYQIAELNGDDLINVIQLNEGWRWEPHLDKNGRAIMQRPFWNNFVEEMKDGILMDAFEYGFTSGGWSMIREGGSKDMEWANGESLL